MVATASTKVRLGTKAPHFALPDTGGAIVSLSDFDDSPALLVIFMCNHCPYVKHVADGLAALAASIKGAAWPWWVSTPTTRRAIRTMLRSGWPKSATARLYVSLLDRRDAGGGQGLSGGLHARLLRLRQGPPPGLPRPDGFQPAEQQHTGQRRRLRKALDAVLSGRPAAKEQKASLGCNIKWKPGNEPD